MILRDRINSTYIICDEDMSISDKLTKVSDLLKSENMSSPLVLWDDTPSERLYIDFSKLKKYEKLKEKDYTDKEIANFLLELIRVKLPELKGTLLIFIRQRADKDGINTTI